MRKRSFRGFAKVECSGCGQPLEEHRVGKQRYCIKCHAKNMRQTRPRHRDLPDEQRKKANARAYANQYIRRGKLQRQPCEVCGEKAQMHHDDYSKPLKVRWFCRKHHLELHNDQRTGKDNKGQ